MLVNLCTAFWFFANLCHFSYVSMSGNKIFPTTVLLGGQMYYNSGTQSFFVNNLWKGR